MDLIHQFTLSFMGFFAIANPVSNLPVFLSLTGEDDADTARAIARKGLIVAFGIVLVFALAGKVIFELFGITLPALRIAGGLLVCLIGFKMVQGEPSQVQHPSAEDRQADRRARLSVAVSPLAMPLLAGPGTIATTMSFSAHSNIANMLLTVLAFAILCLITYVLFLYGKKLVHFIGESALNVITRMMGLILAVIGTQMIIDGIQGAYKW